MKPAEPGAIVLGGHIQAYGILRILGELGIPCVLIDATEKCIARHSRYCTRFFKATQDELPVLLQSFMNTGKYKGWMVIPTDDYQVRFLSQELDRLKSHFTVAVDEWSRVGVFFDKCRSYPFVSDCGVPTPVTYYPQSRDLSGNIVDGITYPCIIKPAIMRDFYAIYRSKAIVCDDATSLLQRFREITKRVPPAQLMVQEIIPGGSENQYSVGVFCDGANVSNHLIARRRRQHPLDFGNATTYAEAVEIPLLYEYAKRILAKIGYCGVCEVEFKQDPRDGRYMFLEVNPRLWKWHLLAKQLDEPILENYRAHLYGYPPRGGSNHPKGAWKDILTDLPVCIQLLIKGRFSRAEKVPRISAVWNKSDPLPFIMQIVNLPFTLIARR